MTPFRTAAALDLSAKVCVVAFSVAIPLLAALVLVNRQDLSRGRMTRSVPVGTARVVGRSCAFAGVVAGFWHILWIAGVGILASALVGAAVQSLGYWRCDGSGSRRLGKAKHPATPGHKPFEGERPWGGWLRQEAAPWAPEVDYGRDQRASRVECAEIRSAARRYSCRSP